MANKIAITNQKGGVGKTTTALNIADAMTHCGYKVLFIDLDPQCNSTSIYEPTVEKDTATIVDVLTGDVSIEEALQTTDLGDIIPGDPQLAAVTEKLNNKMARYALLKIQLKKVEDKYDYVIMDTPPNLGIYMLNAIFAADGCIIPIRAEKFAVDGLSALIDTINEIRNLGEQGNPNLEIYGVLLNSFDKRTKLDKDIWAALPKQGEINNFKVYKTPIRICQTIKDAQAAKVSLFELDAASNAAQDYANLLKEIVKEGK